jgi:MFS family permease
MDNKAPWQRMQVRDKVRWTTAVFFFLSGIITSTWSSRIPDIQRQLRLSDAELGAVLFAISLGLVCALPLSSWLIARFSSIRMMTISAIAYSIIVLLLAIAPSVYLLVTLLFFFGATRNLLSMSANTNSIEVQSLHEKPVIATFHGIWSLACFVGIAIGALMISKGVSPFWHFLCIAALIIVTVLIFKRKERKTGFSSEKKKFFVMPDRYLFILGLIVFCAMFCESCMFDWSINYYDKVIHANKDFVTFGYSAFVIMMTLGRLAGDRFIARFGAGNILWMNGLIVAVGCIVVIFFPYVWIASTGFALIGLGSSIIVPIVYSLAGQSSKMPPGYAIASVTMIGYAGFLSSPLVVGALSEKFGMQAAFGVLVFFSLAIFVLAMGLKKGWWLKGVLGHAVH